MSVEEDWLARFTEGKPKQAVLRVDRDELALSVPHRPASSGAKRAGMALLGSIWVVASLVTSTMVQVGVEAVGYPGLAGAVSLLTLLACLSAGGTVGLSWLRRRHLTSDGRFVMDGSDRVPVETIERVEIVSDGFNGYLVLHTEAGTHRVADGLFPGELEWTASLIRELVERRLRQLASTDAGVAAAQRAAVEKLTER